MMEPGLRIRSNGGIPVSCVIEQAVLDEIKEKQLQQNVNMWAINIWSSLLRFGKTLHQIYENRWRVKTVAFCGTFRLNLFLNWFSTTVLPFSIKLYLSPLGSVIFSCQVVFPLCPINHWRISFHTSSSALSAINKSA